ncbi:MAG: hypothetical protein QG622_1111 [Actinomycetota bacterium]|nr:hypothetical protein [Actinomycetota bacterium]
MPEDLNDALASLRPLLLDLESLVRAVAAGRRRGSEPVPSRVELRPVDLAAGRRLQAVLTVANSAPLTRNVTGDEAGRLVDEMLAEPFGNWHVETLDEVRQLRVTKKGQAQVHVARTSRRDVLRRTGHDRVRQRLLDPGDPLFDALGADADKRRQVDAFLRLLAPVAARAAARPIRAGRPLHVADLGCGNAYLTFAAHRYLLQQVGEAGVRTVGVDVRPDMVARNTELAERLGLTGLEFVVGEIAGTDPGPGDLDVVLALHACDTATDDALAVAVTRRAPVVLAAPCCHHDVQRQLAARKAEGQGPPPPYGALTRHPILRERFADVLTDAVRAGILRLAGYRVDVVEFVDSRHTPRNALIRAEWTGARPDDVLRAEYDDLVTAWGIRPRLADLIGKAASL